MIEPAASSSLDVAYWFFNRAEQDGIYLETEKLQHLLFLAQTRYARHYAEKMLMPCLFLCDEQGFFEPTLKKIFAQGRPFMPPTKLKPEVADFLEQVWREYGSLSSAQCKQLITRLPQYASCYRRGTANVLTWNSLIDKSQDYGTIYNDSSKRPFYKKVLTSQNGPVVVSQWTPRKINNKDYLHD